MPHHRNVIAFKRPADEPDRTRARFERYCQERAAGTPHLAVDYRHLHLKHALDPSTLDLDGHANANRRTGVAGVLWEMFTALRRLMVRA